MRILLVSEGRHELGDAQIESPLRTLVSRILGMQHVYELKKVSDRDLRVHGGRGAGFFKKAVRCLIHAHESGFDAVVMVIDEDGESSRRRQISEANEHQGVNVRRALGIAIRTFDAWMLVDEQALSRVLGIQVSRQPDPEEMRNPKLKAIELRDRSGKAFPITHMYLTLARELDLAVLRERCANGFGIFAERLQSLAR
jgi:hypothetical protein